MKMFGFCPVDEVNHDVKYLYDRESQPETKAAPNINNKLKYPITFQDETGFGFYWLLKSNSIRPSCILSPERYSILEL